MVPAVLVSKITLLIVNDTIYPRADMVPFAEGEIDPNYFWLIKHTPYAEPLFDTRIYTIKDILPIGEEILNCPPHPLYPEFKAYNHTYELIKRPNEDIIRSIENAEKDANNGIISEAQHKDSMIFMLSSIKKEAMGYELTEMELQSSGKLDLVTEKLARNASEKANKIAMVEANLIPNIEEGWVKS